MKMAALKEESLECLLFVSLFDSEVCLFVVFILAVGLMWAVMVVSFSLSSDV